MCRVPMDDGHTLNITTSPKRGRRIRTRADADSGLVPNTTDWYGRFRLIANASNDYQIDRDLQRRNAGPDGYTGIHGVNLQDQAITASMGPIYDRSTEPLQIGWGQLLQSQPNARLDLVYPFSADGKAAPIYFLGTGNFGGSVLKKAPPDRIKEILGVLNYFGAPFGSQESLLLTYGLKDTDFTYDAERI